MSTNPKSINYVPGEGDASFKEGDAALRVNAVTQATKATDGSDDATAESQKAKDALK